jgi:hypothetical protein
VRKLYASYSYSLAFVSEALTVDCDTNYVLGHGFKLKCAKTNLKYINVNSYIYVYIYIALSDSVCVHIYISINVCVVALYS